MGNDTVHNADGKEVESPIELMEIKLAEWDQSLKQSTFVECDFDTLNATDFIVAVTFKENKIQFIFNNGHFNILPNRQLAVVPKRNMPQDCWPYFDPHDKRQASQYENNHALYMKYLTEITSSLSSDENQPSTSRKKKPIKRIKKQKPKTKKSNSKKVSEMPGTSKKIIRPVDKPDGNNSINSSERE